MKAAVKAGYWNLFSFNPTLKAEGKNLSSKPGDGSYQAFLANETRYSSLARKFPDRATAPLAKSGILPPKLASTTCRNSTNSTSKPQPVFLSRRPLISGEAVGCFFAHRIHLDGYFSFSRLVTCLTVMESGRGRPERGTAASKTG